MIDRRYSSVGGIDTKEMFCTRCGRQNDDTANYCQGCGSPLQAPPAAPTVILSPGTVEYATFGQRFVAIVIATALPVMGILNLGQLEMLFPVRTLLLQRRGTVADLHPARGAIRTESGILHVTQIFPFCYRSLTQGLLLNCLQEFLLAAAAA